MYMYFREYLYRDLKYVLTVIDDKNGSEVEHVHLPVANTSVGERQHLSFTLKSVFESPKGNPCYKLL